MASLWICVWCEIGLSRSTKEKQCMICKFLHNCSSWLVDCCPIKSWHIILSALGVLQILRGLQRKGEWFCVILTTLNFIYNSEPIGVAFEEPHWQPVRSRWAFHTVGQDLLIYLPIWVTKLQLHTMSVLNENTIEKLQCWDGDVLEVQDFLLRPIKTELTISSAVFASTLHALQVPRHGIWCHGSVYLQFCEFYLCFRYSLN